MAKGSPFPAAHKGLLDRTLSLFTDVRTGEGVSALLLATNVFYLLAFYQVLKIVRDALILSESGAEAASYASAGMALVLLVFVPAYSALASRVNRVWLISSVTLFFASHLLIFYALGSAGARIGVAFYIWIGVFNMVAVAQFWAFANDLYTNERGKRLFPLVGIGASLGALVGAAIATYFFKGIGPYTLMLIAAFGLTVPVALTIIVHRREGRRKEAKKEEADKALGGPGGFTLVYKQRYLLLIAMLVLVYNLVNTLGGFMLNRMITDEAARQIAAGTAGGATEASIIGTLSGTVQTSVNLLALVLQAFFVSRIFKYIGVRGALFILPAIALTGYSTVALLPILA
ncbi:MAG TPA: Npt1/Npt2 family nucleotide transporter, partial [Vicinamibacterales bacterium]|nr:Npt1/Npt2 family nucleotide transporter [Vicinamibacterales bacterium]